MKGQILLAQLLLKQHAKVCHFIKLSSPQRVNVN